MEDTGITPRLQPSGLPWPFLVLSYPKRSICAPCERLPCDYSVLTVRTLPSRQVTSLPYPTMVMMKIDLTHVKDDIYGCAGRENLDF